MKQKLFVLIIVSLFLLGCSPGGRNWTHLELQVMTDEALQIETAQTVFNLRERLGRNGISHEAVIIEKPGTFRLTGFLREEASKLIGLFEEYFRDWDATVEEASVTANLKQPAEQYLRETAVNQTLETVRNRLKALGVRRAVVQRGTQRDDVIVVEFRGTMNERFRNVLHVTALLELRLVKSGPAPDEATLLADFGGEVPEGLQVLRGNPRSTEGGYYLVSDVPVITGRDLSKVRRSSDAWNNPAVTFSLKEDSARRFELFTSENIGRALAIVIDGKVICAPIIQSAIPDGRGIIQGRFTVEEADDLAVILKAGALPASVKYVAQKTVTKPFAIRDILPF